MKIRGVLLAGAIVVSCVLVSGRAQAQQIFLEISGVPGEVVTPAAFANQIEVLSLSFGGSKPCGAGSLSLSDVNIMKNTDKATVKFSIALRDHTVYPTATIRFTRSDNQVYQVYQLTNMVLESLQTSGSGGSPRTTESVSFTFSQMAVTYTYFDSSGKAGSSDSMTFTAPSCP